MRLWKQGSRVRLYGSGPRDRAGRAKGPCVLNVEMQAGGESSGLLPPFLKDGRETGLSLSAKIEMETAGEDQAGQRACHRTLSAGTPPQRRAPRGWCALSLSPRVRAVPGDQGSRKRAAPVHRAGKVGHRWLTRWLHPMPPWRGLAEYPGGV